MTKKLPVKYQRARAEAERFLEALRALERRCEDEDNPNLIYITGTRETGAVKRASLDLTRALADMRKSSG